MAGVEEAAGGIVAAVVAVAAMGAVVADKAWPINIVHLVLM